MAKNITARNKDFPKWYQDVISAGELADNSPVRGCMVIRPTGFAIWEAMQADLDQKFKETGHVNAYFPLLIPQGFINKEAEHVEGFASELAIVNYAGGKELEENLVIRPTSETIIGHMYSKWLNSYRDLPILINQWSNVVRWEMRPRMFLRTSEFLWQEGHTAHETAEEAQEETLKMLEVYRYFLENTCAIPVLTGEKPDHERFPGAVSTYTLEAMMQDKKALQSGTSHNLGQNFSKAFDIQYLDRENKQVFSWTTSWGVSTRMIGGLIMTHGDDDGIVIPPNLAPTKVVLIPIYPKEAEKTKVLDYTHKIAETLKQSLGQLKVVIDKQDNLRTGDRFFYWIQRGIPLRIEIGPKDVEKKGAMAVRRDNRGKIFLNIETLEVEVSKILKEIQTALYEKAHDFQVENTHHVDTYMELKKIFKEKGGFVTAFWDGTKETAEHIQKETKATIRLILKSETLHYGKCLYTGKETDKKVLFALGY